MRCLQCYALSARGKTGFVFGRGVRWAVLCALLASASALPARGTSLRLVVRAHEEAQGSLAPRTRHFKMCFRQDASGAPVLGLCADKQRRPAGEDEGDRKREGASGKSRRQSVLNRRLRPGHDSD